MRIHWIIVLLISALVLSGCGGNIDNKDQISAAKTFVKALIDADGKRIDKINRSPALLYPTDYILVELAPRFSDFSLSDFEFEISENNPNIVIVTNKETERQYRMEFLEDSGRYYFFDLR
ncbi:hypothetical protein GCM10010965_29790 [Caldalkalibacillus thermarum]|uniref:hypothetical protein n=1 Tax=Caldalkalibacillus thermarum TaxID=296745 RepID=UPI00166B039D|nr:hypothetical protein [Caldalkalibacillus thermarum]GGK34884.1 hypothetical protein GCM10010965_29790 [Caldalkalibacillus thermarum]